MNRRLALSLFSALAVVLSVSTAAAWETRVLTLGDQNRWVEDDANIWLYPQKTMEYGDRLYLDLARKEGRVIDSEGEDEGLATIKGLNGGFFLDLTDSFHMAFWASQQTDMTTDLFLAGAEAVQTPPAACGSNVEESGGNDCGFMSAQGGLNGNALRGYSNGANRKVDLFAGWKVGPGFDMGAHLFFGSGSYNYYLERSISKYENQKGGSSSTEQIWSNSVVGVGLGTSFGLLADSTWDIGLQFAHYSYEMSDNGALKPTVNGGNVFNLDSRFLTRLSKHWWLVPAMQFRYTGFAGLVDTYQSMGNSNGLDDNTSTIDYAGINFDLGLGLQMKVIGKASLFTAVGLDYNQDKFESYSDWGTSQVITYTLMELPYWRTGFEAPLFSWLDMRAGFVKRWGTWQKVTDFLEPGAPKHKDRPRRHETYLEDTTLSLDEASAAEVKDKYAGLVIPADFDTFVGATLHHAGWYFTTEVDPSVLFEGPFNGANGDNWFARFDISYRF